MGNQFLQALVPSRLPKSTVDSCQRFPHSVVFLAMKQTFSITETGEVYRRDPHDWVLLGTLASIRNDPSVVGREVRTWWKSLVESDEALPLLILRDPKLRGPRIPSSDAMIVSGLGREEARVAVAEGLCNNTSYGAAV